MPKILITDDEAQARSTLRQMLRHAGYETVEASDGRECLERLRTASVDLLILDIFMPELDGMEVIAQVRQAFENLPILAISGGGTVEREETLEIAQRLGASRTLAKPFERKAFLSAVRELLGEQDG